MLSPEAKMAGFNKEQSSEYSFGADTEEIKSKGDGKKVNFCPQTLGTWSWKWAGRESF